MSAPATQTPAIKDGALYKKLVSILPVYVSDPFSDAPTLKVRPLWEAIGYKHETVYKWLRNSRLSPENADILITLAHGAENSAALKLLGRPLPTREDLLPFVFGA